MRILTWNINGIRTIVQYHPWNKSKSYKNILHELDADIICFQETKIARSKLSPDIAMIPGYDAYFSFTRSKQGYSGVVTYVKHPLVPLAAEEGITGILHRTPDDTSPSPPAPGLIGHYPPLPTAEAQTLDSEGRCVILDFGLFVLFNIYFPHSSGPDREVFKTQFNQTIARRVEVLLDAGREVVVAADVNVTHREIDHCDPKQSCKDWGLKEFGEHPARRWLEGFLAPNGRMFDLCRKFWPERKGMYTCWNTKMNARPANYGTRLDYILVSANVSPWFRFADTLPGVQGSDHCPVLAELYDSIELSDGEAGATRTVWLRDVMRADEPRAPPALCAKYLAEYSGRQKKLSSFFMKAAGGTAEEEGEEEKNIEVEEEEERVGMGSEGSSWEDAGSVDVVMTKGMEVSGNVGGKNSEAENVLEASAPMETASVLTTHSTNPTPIPAHKPVPLLKRTSSLSATSSSTTKSIKPTPKSKSSSSHSQRTLTSFFKQQPSSACDIITSAPPELPNSSSENGVGAGADVGVDVDVDIDALMAAAATTEATKTQWSELFAPRVAPSCRLHGEPCREFTVGKKGPNQGRRFWLCSRPVGPEMTTTPDGREIKTTEYRCDYFEWSRASGRNSNGFAGKRKGSVEAVEGAGKRKR